MKTFKLVTKLNKNQKATVPRYNMAATCAILLPVRQIRDEKVVPRRSDAHQRNSAKLKARTSMKVTYH